MSAIGQSAYDAMSDVQKAGTMAAYRMLLAQKKTDCAIDDTNYVMQDLAAERLFFDSYNRGYGGRGTDVTKGFLDRTAQIRDAVVANPASQDLYAICERVLQDIKDFYPKQATPAAPICTDTPPTPRKSVPACSMWARAADNTCVCQSPSYPVKCASKAATWHPFPGQHFQLGYADVWTDVCVGHSLDGIVIELGGKARDPSCWKSQRLFEQTHDSSACDPSKPNASAMRIVQFASTVPVTSAECAQCADKSTCASCNPVTGYTVSWCPRIDRKVGTAQSEIWYLDSLSSTGSPYLTPDLCFDGAHLLSDEPTPSIPLADGTPVPVTKTFYDFVMCGTQVEQVFTWTRTGEVSAQWCGVRPTTSKYTNVKAISTADLPVLRERNLCASANIGSFRTNADVQAIGKQLGCSWGN